ncbi:hypothetical protein K1719_025592 [Acacia pycnantha]|nr:hypothetical protein K1719_025592 [Acacia pycnantha]
MEFEEQDQEHEEAEEEMGIPVPPTSYDSARSKLEGGASGPTAGRKGGPTGTVRYRECQKNHAVSIGGHAVDGCGEFLAAGEEGTLDALKCAACNCHRNFHRKEIEGETSSFHLPQPHHPQYHHQFPPYYHGPPPGAGYLHHHLANPAMAHHRPLPLPAAASGGGLSREEEDMSNPSSSGGGGFGGGGSRSERKKRFRTKFTPEQKEKMLAFSEKVGWRIQKHDEPAVEQFCAETGVKRQVLKVWMHNNKNTLVLFWVDSDDGSDFHLS